jgi:hypothetical protein
MLAPCPSPRMITLDQHYGLNLQDLACALGYADALVSRAQRMQRCRTMSRSVTTGQRVRDYGGLCLLAHQRLQHPPYLSFICEDVSPGFLEVSHEYTLRA